MKLRPGQQVARVDQELDFTYTILVEPEVLSPFDHFSEQADAAEIEKAAERNVWAWCSVEVMVDFHGFSASDHLGCCSYASVEEFIKNSGHYRDMKDQARTLLRDQLKHAANIYRRLVRAW